jgi:hypothetical protein
MKRALVLLFLCASAGAALAQGAPSTVSFVARLADGNLPVAGAHDFVFALYDAPSGGTQLWTETRSGVNVPSDGLLYLDLGSVTPLTSTILNGSPRYLEITLDGVVSDPRVVLESVPYSLSAATASHASDSDALSGHPPTYFQRAIGSPCSAGNYVQGIAADGTLTCAPDLNTMYTAGNGLLLTTTTFSIDTTKTQARVTGLCTTGAVQAVNADGSVTCLAAGTGLAYNAGTGAFDVDLTAVQARVPGCATNNAMINTIAQNGAATCITAGTGLTVATGNLNVDTTQIQKRVTGTPCAAGQFVNDIAVNGAATCATPGASSLGNATNTAAAATAQNTNGGAYGTLTGGPAVTVTIPASGNAMITVTGQVNPNTGNIACMSFSGGGIAASDTQAVCSDTGTIQASGTYLVTGITPGSQTFTAQYHSSGGRTATFSNRSLIVIPLP